MKDIKDSQRAHVRIGYDGRVHKTFRGKKADERFANECRVLEYLERKGCDFVPRLLESDEESLTIVTSNCGQPVQKLSKGKTEELFNSLESFGVRHADPFDRNITYDSRRGRFCVIDFELADILKDDISAEDESGNDMAVTWCSRSELGKIKTVNEDSSAQWVFPTDKPAELLPASDTARRFSATDMLVFALSDGMSGPQSGRRASELTMGRLALGLQDLFPISNNMTEAGVEERMFRLAEQVHEGVNEEAVRQPEYRKGMGATLTAVLMNSCQLYFVHVGDSRFYRWRDSELTQLSEDHTIPGRRHRVTPMSERELRTHPQRHLLTQAIGAGQQFVDPQTGHANVRPGDVYLICSDGLIDGLWDKNIVAALEDEPDIPCATDRMCRESIAASGKDNVSVTVFTVE